MRKLGIKSQGTLIIIALFLLIGRVFAVELSTPYIEPSAPKIKEIRSPNGDFFAKVSPDRKITTVYKIDWMDNIQTHLRIGRFKELWSINGCFQVAWLSNDGKYLVGRYEGLNLIPRDYTKDKVILSFFKCGESISKVRLNQLITDFSKLQKTNLGYNWGKCLGLNAAGYFVVETVEGRKILFDVSTGKTARFKSEKVGRLPKWKIYQDIIRCYEFQYPDNCLLNKVVTYDGTLSDFYMFLERKDKGWLINVSVEEMAGYPREDNLAKMSFEEFAIYIAKLRCDADGPNSSQYATRVVRKKLFTNPNNLNVVEFYLEVVNETYFARIIKRRERRTKGPIYAVSISQLDESYRVLSFEFIDEGGNLLQKKEILKKIVNTVRILK